MADKCILRITRELHEVQKGGDLSLAAACRDVDVRHVRALIVGPPETPYEFGFFEFAVKFPKEYPNKPPSVNAITTNSGRTRFNPNIYAQGKVCLSILGTWRGERGEEWSSGQGLESILISIQSLMSANPYENEPGFEEAKSEQDKKNQEAYIAKIRHETIRLSVVERMEDYLKIKSAGPRMVAVYNADEDFESNAFDAPFEPFKDLCKRRFLWYYDSYLQAIDRESMKYKDNQRFERMPFESPGNTMEGTFQYTELRRRLNMIKERLMQEPKIWAEKGKEAVQKEMGIANNLQRQFEQTIEVYKNNENVLIDLELVDDNPFVWQITLFGRPMTPLDGGIFKIRMNISPEFPIEQPRVQVETPIYHHRVSKDGHLCFKIQRTDDLKSYVEAIMAAIEDDSPAYDPRTLVNPEASKLYWGTPDEKKQYNRKLRRSVEESPEHC